MTAPLLLLVLGATLAQPASACPTPSHVVVEVVARLDPLQKEVLDLKAIEDLRDRYGRSARHRTLGFYASTFVYTVRPLDDGNALKCSNDTVMIELVLTGRRVVMAREAAELPCLSDVVSRHYLRHVALDQEALARLVVRLRESVTSTGFSTRADAMSAQAGSVADMLRSVVETEMPAYDNDRRDMQAQADSDAEVASIQDACS
jgi:hypothetical protein